MTAFFFFFSQKSSAFSSINYLILADFFFQILAVLCILFSIQIFFLQKAVSLEIPVQFVTCAPQVDFCFKMGYRLGTPVLLPEKSSVKMSSDLL